jgi:GT2 family glycosyltransferase
MELNISLLVGLKNNLDYTKNFYETTRELYPTVEICFASYGSTDGTHEWLNNLHDENVNFFISDESKTFSDTFNKCVQIATKKYVVFLHNDIVLASGFLENLLIRLNTNNIVSYTTVEPPIFSDHERPGKIIRDFGDSLETFKKDDFRTFAKEVSDKYSLYIAQGATFFMSFPKDVYVKMGGMDNVFNPMFSEDDDLILRLTLQNLNIFTALGAVCYHFVSKTSRFSEEYKERTKEIENQSGRNFLRKWGTRSFQNIKKFDCCYRIANCSPDILRMIEPLATRIYVDKSIIDSYIQSEQPKTKYNLKERILDYDAVTSDDDIVVEFDANMLEQKNLNTISNMQNILSGIGVGNEGSYELDGIFKVIANRIQSKEQSLINLK